MAGGQDGRVRIPTPVSEMPIGPITDFSVPRQVMIRFNWHPPFNLPRDTELLAWAMAYTSTQGLVAFRLDSSAYCLWLAGDRIRSPTRDNRE